MFTGLNLKRTGLTAVFMILLFASFAFAGVGGGIEAKEKGLAVRILDTRERGLANGIQVGAYRIGMILGGGLLLWVFARTDWATMFACMAALLALTVLPVVPLREPARPAAAAGPGAAQVTLGWTRRLQVPGMGALVALVCF